MYVAEIPDIRVSVTTVTGSRIIMEELGTVWIKNDDCVTREIAGETIIVPIKGNVGDLDSIFTLNEVATRLWQLIDGVRTGADVLEIICTEFDVTPEHAENDTKDFLVALESAGLVSRAS